MTMTASEALDHIAAAERGNLTSAAAVLRAMRNGELFNALSGGVTASAAELNKLDGATCSTSELNKLTGSGALVASGAQQAAITAPSGGGTVDAEARTAIGLILTALAAFGITA